MNLQSYIVGTATFGLMIVLLFLGIYAIAGGMNVAGEDIYDTAQVDFTSVQDTLLDYTDAANVAENISFSQKTKEYSDSSGFNILDSAKTLIEVIKVVPADTMQILYNIFGIPAWIFLVGLALFIVVGLILAYLLIQGVG